MTESRLPGFEDREKAQERKFQQDQELAFKIRTRRNKLLGLWAAERLGLAGEAAEAYGRELVALGLAHSGDETIIATLARDFAAKNVAVDAVRLHLELERCTAEARRHHGAAQ